MLAHLGVRTAFADTPRERPVVLVVDDDVALQLLAGEALDQGWFAVEPATTCAEALAAFPRARPDVVVLDVNLPDGDGFGVCTAIRQMRGGATIPVLMMTADDDVGAIHRAYEVGATDFITKPISWVLLRYRLRYILRAAGALDRVAVSEAWLTRAQHMARLGHWELDLDTQRMRWSREAARMFSPEPPRPETGPGALYHAIHPDDRDRVRAAVAAVVSSGQPVDMEFRIVTPAGDEGTVHQRAELAVDEMGEARSVVATVQDVTERVRLEAQLRQAQKMEAVGRLAGGIAHDFNNLLTVINCRCELLLGRLPEDNPAIDDVRLILQAGEHAAALTSQLLMFSRKQILQRAVLDLNEVVQGLTPLVQRVLGEDIAHVLHLDPALGRVFADRTQIEQVLLNLVVNARDAMPRGGRLSISTANVECDQDFVRRHPGSRPGAHVRLGVGDTGTGMDEATLSRIFEPFFTTKGLGQGTGLGLATVYGIVKHHGGYIGVESAPGEGTTFSVFLERVEAPSSPSPEIVPLTPAQGEVILLAEDDDRVRHLCRESLGEAGYEVLEAPRGEEALRIAEAHAGPIHLLVTDVVMPGMSGGELARQFGVARPGTPTLFVSGYPGDMLGAFGFVPDRGNFLAKPFSTDALLRTVRAALDTRASRAG